MTTFISQAVGFDDESENANMASLQCSNVEAC